jgi:DNA-binding transcriptional ArsR family regulator
MRLYSKLALPNILDNTNIHIEGKIMQLDEIADKATEAAALLKELANEKRLMICCALADQELCVGDINELVPLSQSALSQHLARLREQGIVVTRRDGQSVYYSLAGDSALKIIMTLRSIYCPD